MKREMRSIPELRAEGAGDEMALVGYAALFNVQSKDLGGFRETVAPGAFTRSLKENADVKATFNHDPNRVLGRTKSGTLELKQDERGLWFRAKLDPTQQLHRDIHASVKRGDIDECSFAFKVPTGGDTWKEPTGSSDAPFERTLTDVDLFDVAAVCYPAYGGTSVDARMLFPDGEVVEVRSAIETLTGQRVARQKEQRDAEEKESYEQEIKEVSTALAERYPAPAGENWYGAGKYWVVETYPDYVIVCEGDSGDYFKISYTENESEETYVFGNPEPVEKEWVPATERGKKRLGEYRALKPVAPATRAVSTEHEEGDCGDSECACQNRLVDPEDIYDEEDNGEGTDDERSARRIVRIAEQRAKGKVRTKSVDGKNLTESSFAYVGDPAKTETWKLPIHDADHARNALARFGQTKGIPAAEKAGVLRKIKAAAAKFGVQVSDEDSARMLAETPMDAVEVERTKQLLWLAANAN